jgi:hypothetical protein
VFLTVYTARRSRVYIFTYNYLTTLKLLGYVWEWFYDYTKEVLERVSFNPDLFTKELKKAVKIYSIRNGAFKKLV